MEGGLSRGGVGGHLSPHNLLKLFVYLLKLFILFNYLIASLGYLKYLFDLTFLYKIMVMLIQLI